MLVVIFIIIFGVIKYIIFGTEGDINGQTINFLTYVIPAIIGTGMIIPMVLNLVEKKDLKAVTKLNTELLTTFVKKLENIETVLLEIRQNEIDQEEESLKKEKEHIEVHKKLDSTFTELTNKLNHHIQNHN
jgi:hypothetical protein